MRNLSIICLSTLFLVSGLLEPAEAGRRARRGRRAAVVAGVTGGTAAAAVVASRGPRTTVVAAAPVRKAAPIVVLPDLTIAEISEVDAVHCVVVKNIGKSAADESLLQINFTQAADGALVSSSPARVPALQPGQSVRVRLHAIPAGHVFLAAYADADHKVAEANEENNASQLEIVPAVPAAPAELPDVDVWLGPEPLPTATDNQASDS